MAKKSKEPKAPEETPEGEEPEKKSGGMMGTIALVFAAIAGSFGATYFLSPTPASKGAGEACEVAEKKPEPIRASVDQEFVPLEEIIITIGSSPSSRYLKMQVSVVTNKESAEYIKSSEPILMDAFINYLRSVEIDDFEDPKFYSNMRRQLSRRSELVVGAASSDGVLITEFLLR
jgi:flagellar FliL protein